jgi:hypothetical protein
MARAWAIGSPPGLVTANGLPKCALRRQVTHAVAGFVRSSDPIRACGMRLRTEPPVWYAADRRFGGWPMSVHVLSIIERKFGGTLAPNPDECREHFDSGRLPVYYGRKLVAYVDEPDDLPEARFVERDGRLMGELDAWHPSAERFAA